MDDQPDIRAERIASEVVRRYRSKRSRGTPSLHNIVREVLIDEFTRTVCTHPGGFRTDEGKWECSRCGHLFASHEAWGTETGHEGAVAAVNAAIERDILAMEKEG